jgi:hypothetical protein
MNRCQRESGGIVAVSAETDCVALCGLPVEKCGRVELHLKRGLTLCIFAKATATEGPLILTAVT